MKHTEANDLKIYRLSEGAVTIEFGDVIDEDIMNSIRSFDRSLHKNPFKGMSDTVPAYTTLTVFYDLMEVLDNDGLQGKSCFEKVSGYLRSLKHEYRAASIDEREVIDIPVCYGGLLGPDLEYVAKYRNLAVDEIIKLHCQAIYRVHMIGFIPGFAYMGGLDERLETPRKATPRKAVPAGAVGIAGKQTGIYPLESPGGWQIIGQTPVRLFDAKREFPAMLKAGDRVQFKQISVLAFDKYNSR